MIDLERRIRVLRAHGAEGEAINELLRYNENQFDQAAGLRPRTYPLVDEEFVSTWIGYAKSAAPGKGFDFLKTRLVQLNFPIREGISQCEDYIAASKRGQSVEGMEEATGLVLKQPGQLRILIYQAPAGNIPILHTPHRPDFVALVRALTMRNEPMHVPESMGACMVSGYNNWDRIRAYRVKWQIKNSGKCLESDWNAEFLRLIPRKDVYQDRFLLLSGGFYSGVAPAALKLSDTEWRAKSLVIRREHECTHYLTRRVFSSMRDYLLDELIADYIGIVAAAGRFRADWFLHFMGLESSSGYRSGGRLENYRGKPPLSDSAFRILQAIVTCAAKSLEEFTDDHVSLLSQPDFQPLMVTALTTLTLEELADAESHKKLAESVQRSQDRSKRQHSKRSDEKLCHSGDEN
jgi:hypothetical protein